MERTKTASGRLWCRAEEPVPLGINQSGIARETFSGTPTPCSRSLSFRQVSIPMRDEPYLPFLGALAQELRPAWCLLVCIPLNVEIRHLRAIWLMLSVSPHNGQQAEKKKKKKNYADRGNSPYINQGKGDTLAQKSRESPPPPRRKKH
eukprot:1144425-Pelagomonas_calceolata.AAC.1